MLDFFDHSRAGLVKPQIFRVLYPAAIDILRVTRAKLDVRPGQDEETGNEEYRGGLVPSGRLVRVDALQRT